MSNEQVLFKIPSKNLQALNEGLERLNKKAKKLGNPEISTRLVSNIVNTLKDGRIETFLILEIIGMAPRLEGGWEFLGTLQHTPAGNILRSVPNKEIPVEYRSGATKCDHCKKVRNRKDTYIVKAEDGRVMQVGHSCVKDFLGHSSPARLALLAEIVQMMGDAEEEGFGGEGYLPRLTLTKFFMAQAVACVRVQGYVSRAAVKAFYEKSEGRGFLMATSDAAWMQLYPTDQMRKTPGLIYGFNEEDLAYGEKVLAWAATLEPTSDYNHNLKIACAQEIASHREGGLIASAVGAYQKHLGTLKMREKKIREDLKSEHFGVVGARADFTVTVMGEHQFETNFGLSTLFRMKDENGNIAIWFTASGDLEVGKTYKIKGTVKEHSLYKDIKQTVLSRCKVLEVIESAEPSALESPQQVSA